MLHHVQAMRRASISVNPVAGVRSEVSVTFLVRHYLDATVSTT